MSLLQVNGRIALSTKTLEPEPGDMIKSPQKVYDMAEVSPALLTRRIRARLSWSYNRRSPSARHNIYEGAPVSGSSKKIGVDVQRWPVEVVSVDEVRAG